MRFICADLSNNKIDLCIPLLSSNDYDIQPDGKRYDKLMQIEDKKTNSKTRWYARLNIFKFNSNKKKTRTARTIAEISSDIGIVIDNNFGTSFNYYFTWDGSKASELISDYWFTIITDEGIYLASPNRIKLSKPINGEVIARYNNYMTVGYENETGFNKTISAENRYIIPIKTDESLKNMAVSKETAINKTIHLYSGNDAKPLDYFVDEDNILYVAVGKRPDQNKAGYYVYEMVAEVTRYYTMTGADVINADNELALIAQQAMTGGGAWTYASSSIKWGSSILIKPVARPDATDGYFTIDCPSSGSVNVLAADETYTTVTATANGIPLASGEALYYKLPWGSANTSVQANFLIVPVTLPNKVNLDGYVMICVYNATTGKITTGTGEIITAATSYLITTAGTSTWTAQHTGLAVITGVGGGAGGGSGAGGTAAGGGGGGGGQIKQIIMKLIKGYAYNCTVGAKGAAGADGSSSVFGNITATGGKKGANGSGTTGGAGGQGGGAGGGGGGGSGAGGAAGASTNGTTAELAMKAGAAAAGSTSKSGGGGGYNGDASTSTGGTYGGGNGVNYNNGGGGGAAGYYPSYGSPPSGTNGNDGTYGGKGGKGYGAGGGGGGGLGGYAGGAGADGCIDIDYINIED